MPARTATKLNYPAYLINFPFTVDNRSINNVLMEAYQKERYNYDKAFSQFLEFYHFLAKQSLVYILPSKGNFQDQTFVANLGCCLPHMQMSTVVISNFKSEPRQGEDDIGVDFFYNMEYTVIRPKTFFEGEADLKWLRNNLYVGGYGIRTDRKSYDWLAERTEAEIIGIEMSDSKLYHFDCMFMPFNGHKAAVATKAVKPKDLRRLDNLVEIVDIPQDFIYNAWTNCLVIGKQVIHTPVTPDSGVAWCDFIDKQGYEPVIINLTEFEKSGASLSCMVMHLNYLGRGD